ncbi:LysR family transcriptional regulator [Leucothrix arctica]|uniref:LysR family transcriptional regulator n=1 Tax=Leucothrix arctica TaxID=1481894 RepID=A0A317C916_9GAMM|nr:LysR family transcriptional regulator [Leucothrix arctica]PWQ94849.1 LysR family transcriptional regulator [Leucothrix arctica]
MSGFDDLFWLVEVVDAGTFTAAANKHGISSAAISKRIRLMEARLNVTLLVRTTRHLRMTEVGEMYYRRGKQLLEEFNYLESSVTSANEQLSGRIRINAPLSYGLADLVKPINKFMGEYPELEVVLHFDDRTIDIFSSDYDVVIRIGELADSSLVTRRIASMNLVCCASSRYLEQHGEPKTPEALNSHNCLVYQQDDTFSTWKFSKDGQSTSVTANGSLLSNSGDFLCQSACEHQGIVCLPEFIARKSLDTSQLVPLLTDYSIGTLHIYAVYPSRHYLPLKVKQLIEFLKSQLNTQIK